MNCKPNELAVIVKTGEATGHLIGLVVRLTELTNDCFSGVPAWKYLSEQKLIRLDGNAVLCLEDCCLKPIRGVRTKSHEDVSFV